MVFIVPTRQMSCFSHPIKLDLTKQNSFSVGRRLDCSLVLDPEVFEARENIQFSNVSRQVSFSVLQFQN